MNLALSVLMVLSFAVGIEGEDYRCLNCRMKSSLNSPFNVTVTSKDGSQKTECSLYCASMEAERLGTGYAGIKVVDYDTGEEIDPASAIWVEGSDVRPVMGDESRIPFKEAAAAEAFIKEHGGHTVSFDEAWQDTMEEWKAR